MAWILVINPFAAPRSLVFAGFFWAPALGDGARVHSCCPIMGVFIVRVGGQASRHLFHTALFATRKSV